MIEYYSVTFSLAYNYVTEYYSVNTIKELLKFVEYNSTNYIKFVECDSTNLRKIMIKRFYNINEFIKQGKVLIIFGARQAGKTTLLNEFLSNTKLKYKLDSGDNIRTQQILGSQDFSLILNYAEGYNLLAIDEAQNIPNIGTGLKILIDNFPDLSIIATGSSSFALSQDVGEPLTGRKREIVLYPLSQIELLEKYNKFELKEKLEEFLIYGSYPEVIVADKISEKKEILDELVNSYLLKDIFALERIKAPRQLFDLLKLLSFQVGNLVSLHELAEQVRMDVKTVGRYLDLLEKGYVIKRIGGYSRNLRKEVVSKAKYYFIDNGVRNAIISQYNSINDRDDIGALFENFIFTEIFKINGFKRYHNLLYFWRTYQGQEIDLIEERDGKTFAYEIKWTEKSVREPKLWNETYKDSIFQIIHRNNYLDFLLFS